MGFFSDRIELLGLVKVYGNRVPDCLADLAGQNPDLGHDKLVEIFKKEPTSIQSFFGREPNLHGLAWMIGQDRSKDWKVLSAGCGGGPEPYELAMLLLKEGRSNFQIDGFDSSDNVIEKAKKGKFTFNRFYSSYFEKKFFPEVIEEGHLLPDGSEDESSYGAGYVDYEASPQVKETLSFFVHDLIEGPFQPMGQAVYDIIICNNVFMHYPQLTREVMLGNLLTNLKSGGFLALERDQFLGGLFSTEKRENWLRPYYKWKDTLGKFGLQPEAIEGTDLFIPPVVYHYMV